MGAEESRAAVGGAYSPAAKGAAADGAAGGCLAAAAVDFPNSCGREGEAVAWTLVHQTTADRWKQGHAEACYFSETTLSCDGGLHKDCSQSFCIARQGFVNLGKASSIFSFRKRSKFYEMAEHFEYNHIPAQMSSVNHFHFMSVLCFRDNLVVLHLSRNNMDQLGLLDLKVNKFLGVFAKIQSPFMSPTRLYGALSPDKTKCLVRQPSAASNDDTDCLALYDVINQVMVAKVELRVSCASHLTFDPRFDWQRAAITNFTCQAEVTSSAPANEAESLARRHAEQGEQRAHMSAASMAARRREARRAYAERMAAGGSFDEQRHGGVLNTNTLSIVQLDSLQPLQTNTRLCDTRPHLYPYMRDLQYSRDGSLIVATLLDTPCHCREKRAHPSVSCSVYVLSGDTAQTLHCIQIDRFTCAAHACLTNYVPLLSDCGSRMAVLVNAPAQPDVNFVQVYKLPHVLQLQNLCRVAIRQQLRPSAAANQLLSRLPLPPRLIDYLRFKPEF